MREGGLKSWGKLWTNSLKCSKNCILVRIFFCQDNELNPPQKVGDDLGRHLDPEGDLQDYNLSKKTEDEQMTLENSDSTGVDPNPIYEKNDETRGKKIKRGKFLDKNICV